MMKVPIEKLLEKVENPFQLVIAAARRVKQLNNNAPKLTEAAPSKRTTTALMEIMEGRVSMESVPDEEEESENGVKEDEKEK